MATYKLIQDIEAEDHILGPLTFRQFVFMLLTAFFIYLNFLVITKGAPFLMALFLPPTIFCAFFAAPWGRDQPTETWALAKVRYWFKPRARTWNQSGVKELVTITAPKKVDRHLTKDFTQTEVKSRLKALGETLDSRGWAIKNVNNPAFTAGLPAAGSDDRLIAIGSIPRNTAVDDVPPSADIMDNRYNPVAQQFGAMIDNSTKVHRQELMNRLNNIRADEANGSPYWFMWQNPQAPQLANNNNLSVATLAKEAGPQPPEASLSAQVAEAASLGQAQFNNLRTLQPTAPTSQPVAATPVQSDDTAHDAEQEKAQAQSVTTPSQPAILSLSKNDDLNVSTLAREANKKQKGGDMQNEVVISLH